MTEQHHPVSPAPLAAPMSNSGSCPNCGTAMLNDQRYCLNCGERRGAPRLDIMNLKSTGQPPAPVYMPAQPNRNYPSGNTALLAGLATLILAMGVGVLIGHSNNGSDKVAAGGPPQVITVGGAGAAAAPAAVAATGPTGPTATTTTDTTETTASTDDSSGSEKVSTSSGAAADSAAAKAHIKPKKVAPKGNTEKVGDPCKAGSAGCTDGKFTGNFFGP